MANIYLEDRVLRALDNLSAINTLANPQEPDYWEKLLHQYAGMAMQGILSNISFMKISEDAIAKGERAKDITARTAIDFASALVEKLKNSEAI